MSGLQRSMPSLFLVFLFAVGACTLPEPRKEVANEAEPFESSFYEQNTNAVRRGELTPTQTRSDRPTNPLRKTLLFLPVWNDTKLALIDTPEKFRLSLLSTLAEADRYSFIDEEGLEPADTFVDRERVRVAQLYEYARRKSAQVVVLARIFDPLLNVSRGTGGLIRKSEVHGSIQLEYKVFDIINEKEVRSGRLEARLKDSEIQLFGGVLEVTDEKRAEWYLKALEDSKEILAREIVYSTMRLDWEGRIARISGNQIYINAGSASGLHKGDLLRVLGGGVDLYDSVSGTYIGKSPGVAKGTLEILDFTGPSASIGRIHSGGQFKEGDRVRLY